MTNPNDLIRRGDALKDIRKWWRFDDAQQHTHSWHDREDFIEKINALPAAVSSRTHVITVTCDDDSTDRGPVWIATHLGSGITAEARTPADAVALCADRVPREAWTD